MSQKPSEVPLLLLWQREDFECVLGSTAMGLEARVMKGTRVLHRHPVATVKESFTVSAEWYLAAFPSLKRAS